MKRVRYRFVFLILLVGFIMQIIPAYADSGWDSSYDSGGSSSWDSGSSSWGSSSFEIPGGGYYFTKNGKDILFIAFNVFAVLIYIIWFIKLVIRIVHFYKEQKEIKKIYPTLCIQKSYPTEKIIEILPDFDKNRFRIQAFEVYKKIQIAWMNFDYEALRKCTTDELYNLYHSQLVALQVKKQKNVMEDFELKAFEIVGMEKIENMVALTVQMTVECFDYVVDKNNKVVRGTDKNKLIYDYEMTFIKGMDQKENKCPNCNAPLENGNSTVCPYCDSVIINNNHDWVLSKKEMKNQYRK